MLENNTNNTIDFNMTRFKFRINKDLLDNICHFSWTFLYVDTGKIKVVIF